MIYLWRHIQYEVLKMFQYTIRHSANVIVYFITQVVGCKIKIFKIFSVSVRFYTRPHFNKLKSFSLNYYCTVTLSEILHNACTAMLRIIASTPNQNPQVWTQSIVVHKTRNEYFFRLGSLDFYLFAFESQGWPRFDGLCTHQFE